MTFKLWHSVHARSIRPLWLAKEMGLEIDVEVVSMDRPWLAGEEWAEVNPAGKVPAAEHEGVRFGESVAMMQYLLARFGPSDLDVPADHPDFGPFLFWLHFAEAGSCMYVATWLGNRAGMPEYAISDGHEALCLERMARMQTLIARATADRPWLLSKGFTAADIAMGYTLHLARLGKYDLTPPVAAYLKRLRERPAFSDSVALGKS
ncbi:MAG: glutathione S-transferase family protein [Pseudomonadota bacterium]